MDFKKLGIPIALASVGIVAAVFLFEVLSTPGGKSPEQVEAERRAQESQNPQVAATSEMLSTTQLQINRMETRVDASEKNVNTIYKNQTELEKSLKTLQAQAAADRKTITDQRAYIAMLYQKVLDMEMKVDSLGGGISGLSGRPRQGSLPQSAPNPLLGTDSLPSLPSGDPQLLPPLTE